MSILRKELRETAGDIALASIRNVLSDAVCRRKHNRTKWIGGKKDIKQYGLNAAATFRKMKSLIGTTLASRRPIIRHYAAVSRDGYAFVNHDKSLRNLLSSVGDRIKEADYDEMLRKMWDAIANSHTFKKAARRYGLEIQIDYTLLEKEFVGKNTAFEFMDRHHSGAKNQTMFGYQAIIITAVAGKHKFLLDFTPFFDEANIRLRDMKQQGMAEIREKYELNTKKRILHKRITMLAEQFAEFKPTFAYDSEFSAFDLLKEYEAGQITYCSKINARTVIFREKRTSIDEVIEGILEKYEDKLLGYLEDGSQTLLMPNASFAGLKVEFEGSVHWARQRMYRGKKLRPIVESYDRKSQYILERVAYLSFVLPFVPSSKKYKDKDAILHKFCVPINLFKFKTYKSQLAAKRAAKAHKDEDAPEQERELYDTEGRRIRKLMNVEDVRDSSNGQPTKQTKKKKKGDERDVFFVLLTNNLKLSGREMARVYRHRWTVEDFIKNLKDKETFNLKSFRTLKFSHTRLLIFLNLISVVTWCLVACRRGKEWFELQLVSKKFTPAFIRIEMEDADLFFFVARRKLTVAGNSG